MVCKRKGFTLIELLLVIAIVALLLAILLPAVQRVRKQAKAVVCRSNLKQWSIATMTYCIEYEDKMWSDSYPQAGSTVPGDWMEILRPYYQDIAEIRCCPVATRPCQDPHNERRPRKQRRQKLLRNPSKPRLHRASLCRHPLRRRLRLRLRCVMFAGGPSLTSKCRSREARRCAWNVTKFCAQWRNHLSSILNVRIVAKRFS